jgi:MFS family permease
VEFAFAGDGAGAGGDATRIGGFDRDVRQRKLSVDTWKNDNLTRQAMICAAIAMAHQVASKATRDALFLGAFPSTDLPRIVIAGAGASLVLGWLFSRLLSRFGPRRVVPAGFVLSAIVQAAAWQLEPTYPRFVAAAMYLHLVAFGAVLLSGFWSMSSELFDARTAKLRFGRIAGAGTAGGITGGIMAERVAAWLPPEYALLMLALLHLAAAVGLVMLRSQPEAVKATAPEAEPAWVVFQRAPYLWYLAGLVLLGTASAAVLDYLFKVGAAETFGRGANLLRFFAVFYTSAQILTFLTQTFLTRPALEKMGLSRTVATLPIAVGLGGMAALSFEGRCSDRGTSCFTTPCRRRRSGQPKH